MGEMAVLNRQGDTKVIWDPENLAEVEAAQAQFNTLRGKGYLAYEVTGRKGEKGSQMCEFDPEAGKVILAPALRGG